MVLTPSTMLPLGTLAPHFMLPDVTGKLVDLNDFKSAPGLLVMFICNHCPYVKHVRQELAKLTQEYLGRGVAVVGINSNDVVSHPEDHPKLMAEEVKNAGYKFPYLFDETQEIAKQYHAACTPDFFVFNASRSLIYRGQMDSSRPGNGIAVTGEDLRRSLDAVLSGAPYKGEQKPSLGCNIKWKPGNEPKS